MWGRPARHEDDAGSRVVGNRRHADGAASTGGMNVARPICQNGLAVNVLHHHARQRSTVRRLTTSTSYSCRILAAVAPSRMIAISTTSAKIGDLFGYCL